MSSDSQVPVIVWFRQDLRTGDNPALSAAARSGAPVLPVYVLDDENAGDFAMGAASRWWLHRSLAALDEVLGGSLHLMRGPADAAIPALVQRSGARAVCVNRCFEPWRTERDARIRTVLAQDGVELTSWDGSLLFDPDAVLKRDGTPYRVFTPFWRNGCLGGAEAPRDPLPAPGRLTTTTPGDGLGLDELELLGAIHWYRGLENAWQVGEDAALERLDRFLDSGLPGYRDGRDRLDKAHVSRLSPHLHFGEISPHQVWHGVRARQADPRLGRDVDSFLSELGWREFSYYLLRHFPTLPSENLQPKFDRFPWQPDSELIGHWQRGMTGYPIVDAGMRELRETGYMHNRVRMIAGSFLVKNLLTDWRRGEAWFRDTLVDADLANNSASWQWVAGTGTDAAPYFRIFNPVTQAKKFDPDGHYVRRFVPELGEFTKDEIHEPWAVPRRVRDAIDYPEPIVDLKATRDRALAAFKAIAGQDDG